MSYSNRNGRTGPWLRAENCTNPHCDNPDCPNYRGGTPLDLRDVDQITVMTADGPATIMPNSSGLPQVTGATMRHGIAPTEFHTTKVLEPGILVAGTFVKADDIDYGSDGPIVVDAGPYPGNEPERYAGVDLAENPPPLPERFDGPAGVLAWAELPQRPVPPSPPDITVSRGDNDPIAPEYYEGYKRTGNPSFDNLQRNVALRAAGFDPKNPATWTPEQVKAFNSYRHVTVQDETSSIHGYSVTLPPIKGTPAITVDDIIRIRQRFEKEYGTSYVPENPVQAWIMSYIGQRIAAERRKIAAYLRQLNDACPRTAEDDYAIIEMNSVIRNVEEGKY